MVISKENETSGNRAIWYHDYTSYFTFYSPLTKRGGGFDNGTGAGIYYLVRCAGNAVNSNSFRIVLAI